MKIVELLVIVNGLTNCIYSRISYLLRFYGTAHQRKAFQMFSRAKSHSVYVETADTKKHSFLGLPGARQG